MTSFGAVGHAVFSFDTREEAIAKCDQLRLSEASVGGRDVHANWSVEQPRRAWLVVMTLTCAKCDRVTCECPTEDE